MSEQPQVAEEPIEEETRPQAEQRPAPRRGTKTLKVEVAEDSPLRVVRSAGILFSDKASREVTLEDGDPRETELRACPYLKVRKLPG